MRDEDDSGTEQRDTTTGTVRSTWSDYRHPSTAVVEAVAAATNRDSATMVPLHHEVDTDALDALVMTAANGTGDGVSVSFRYDGVAVTVHGDGGIEVRPRGSSAER